MAEDDVEPFEMGNDYEGGQWIGGEFFYSGTKKQRKFTKEDAIYGIFNEPEDDGDRPGLGTKGKSKYGNSGGVSFIPGGKVTSEADEEEGDSSQQVTIKAKTRPDSFAFKATVPAQFGRGQSRASSGADAPKTAKEKGPKDWEKYTGGRGSKLLAKMGYVGGGLGVKGTGIENPLEAQKLPTGMGLGFGKRGRTGEVDEEELKEQEAKENMALQGEAQKEEEEEEAIPSWKKTSDKIRRATKKKVVYRTAEELRQAPTKQVIIDMTGKEGPRVVADAAELAKQGKQAEAEAEAEPDRRCAELRHNMKILVDLNQIKVQEVDRKVVWERDRLARMKRRQTELMEKTEVAKKNRQKLEELSSIITACVAKCKANQDTISLLSLASAFAALRERYPQEYNAYQLPLLAANLVQPILKKTIAPWNPLSEPATGIDTMRACMAVLESDHSHPDEESRMTSEGEKLYRQLCDQIVMPKIRTAVTNAWDPKNPEPAINLLERWKNILPLGDFDILLQEVILPRLNRAVEEWNPRTDPVPIHAWIHPWLPWLRNDMDIFYPVIRHKLTAALYSWNPMDRSAILSIKPWANVFDKKSLGQFLEASIIPKLERLLTEMPITPEAQEIAPFQRLMDWEDVLTKQQLVDLLCAYFFPRWVAVLRHWLASKPNYGEVSRWYSGWKNQFSADLIADDRIRLHFNDALKLIGSFLK